MKKNEECNEWCKWEFERFIIFNTLKIFFVHINYLCVCELKYKLKYVILKYSK